MRGCTVQAAAVPPDTSRLQPLSRQLLDWLGSRGISQAVLHRNQVMMESRYCRSLGAWVDHIAFPFFSGGRVVNIKYRALPKHFQQSPKGQQVFYGLHDIRGDAPAVLIVEGELDKLSVEEATGATAHCSHIVIGVDADAAGWHTAQQLADRLGRGRCWYLAWPAAGPAGAAALQRVAAAAAAEGIQMDVAAGLGCKDANDLLLCYGKRVLALYVHEAPVPFPLQ
ncbi:hypothetical protein OEZ86_011858 [Tetradesmus obliquus]|nr:hypothetical protein OEZ86_011858 [Tetradesmus obliquus]